MLEQRARVYLLELEVLSYFRIMINRVIFYHDLELHRGDRGQGIQGTSCESLGVTSLCGTAVVSDSGHD